MPELTAADEYFYHQIPEPLPNVIHRHDHWRESLFFVLHPKDHLGDTVILTMAQYPKREILDSLQMGTIGTDMILERHERPYDGDPHTLTVGPVSIDIVEPYKKVRLTADADTAPIGLDMTFDARTREKGLRRGSMKLRDEIIWDQSHMIQSGIYNGTYSYQGKTYEVNDWWGQRDHSWGIRNHSRCPFWMWLAIQLPDGMISVWNWEYANGARIYTDGCYSPSDMSEPIPVISFQHELYWTDKDGNKTDYQRDGENVIGISGDVTIQFENKEEIQIHAQGRWACRYGALGGGLLQIEISTDGGIKGTAIYELTGAHHHRYFPVARSENLPTSR